MSDGAWWRLRNRGDGLDPEARDLAELAAEISPTGDGTPEDDDHPHWDTRVWGR